MSFISEPFSCPVAFFFFFWKQFMIQNGFINMFHVN